MLARFLFAVTQPGAERPLKNEIAREHPELRFAFSRPGFVTFRLPDVPPRNEFVLRSVFARTWGYSFGKVTGADDAKLARETWRAVAEQRIEQPLRHLHLY